MIKTATILRASIAPDNLIEQLGALPFQPTGPTQQKSFGWVPPNDNEYVETVMNCDILKLKIETRKVPAAVVEKEVDRLCKLIEQDTGRKPGKKEKREIKEDVTLSLLPQAFPSQSVVTILWRDNTLVIDGSAGQVDDAITALVKCVDGFIAAPVQTVDSPAAVMAGWLIAESAVPFIISDECCLSSEDASVKYTHHNILTDEVKDHITQGKRPTLLALSTAEFTFQLTDEMKLKKLDFEPIEGEFEASAALCIASLFPVLDDLIQAFGGEVA